MDQKLRKTIWRIVVAAVTAILSAIGAAYGLTSCNVTRAVTTESIYTHKGDTTTTITTRTIETYNAKKNNSLSY